MLLHDGSGGGHDRTTTVEVLPLLIMELKEQGYSFIDPASVEGQKFLLSYAARRQKH